MPDTRRPMHRRPYAAAEARNDPNEVLTTPLPRIPAASARTVYQLQRMRHLSAQAMTKIDEALGRAG
ncbi:hypothetical protein [Nonomuraea sediminis]|uniref:hypothetical protein n=1 Tax=Nonomuraea sediminis TaxID=2835864 RepID=UPI001BDCB9EF|nr:hypothetical protein [Nonomuraea sediminis]